MVNAQNVKDLVMLKTKLVILMVLVMAVTVFGEGIMERNRGHLNADIIPISQAVRNRIKSTKIQILKIYAKAMAAQNGISYRSSYEDVISKYKVQIVEISSDKTKLEQNIAKRNARIAKKYDKVKARLSANKEVKIFREHYSRSTKRIYVFHVNQVLEDGYYLISKSSKIYRLYAPTLSMVDKDEVPNIFVKKTGIFKYANTGGSKSTVESYIMLAHCYDDME